MPDAAASRAPYGAALYLAWVQFLFVTCWTIYVIYLPALLESVGLPKTYTPWILILDQLTFMVMDVVMGLAADRAARTLGRIGPLIVGLTALSCIAFLLIPHVAMPGAAASWVMLALVLVWTVTSSALRAPPWVLIGRHAATPSVPWLNALMLSGLAVGGAVAPYLGIVLKNLDPRVPFAISSITLLAVTAGLVWVERALGSHTSESPPRAVAPASASGGALPGSWLFAAGCLLLALGFQVHFSLNSAGQYLRLADAGQLPYLMPVFWIGFNVAMFPGAALAKRHGTLHVIAAAALVGAAAVLVSTLAGSLELLLAAQLVTGGAWGCMLMACFSAALEFGHTGREGFALGILFAAIAAATLARIVAAVAELVRLPGLGDALGWAPFVFWVAAALIFAALAAKAAAKAARRSAAAA
ncbi:MAG TPA: MFS transporter [Burkholderiales bacterium]|nr:MFS transporter [Burkholderiales bacterium]